MQIQRAAQLHGPQPINSPHMSRVSKPTTPSQSAPITDEVQISEAAQLLEQVNQVPDIRQGRVDAIRMQIAAGTYETEEKLQLAVGRLLEEIG